MGCDAVADILCDQQAAVDVRAGCASLVGKSDRLPFAVADTEGAPYCRTRDRYTWHRDLANPMSLTNKQVSFGVPRDGRRVREASRSIHAIGAAFCRAKNRRHVTSWRDASDSLPRSFCNVDVSRCVYCNAERTVECCDGSSSVARARHPASSYCGDRCAICRDLANAVV
jgi:hypothetical protein